MNGEPAPRLDHRGTDSGGWTAATDAPQDVDAAACQEAIADGSLLAELLGEVREVHDDVDLGVIERAFELSRQAHDGQLRKSGEPYFIHPIRVARTIARLGLDVESVASGLLHDAVEDSELSAYDLSERFGREVASLVDGVTKLGKVPYLSRKEQQAESFRKMLLAMSQDIRVLLVKLADRLDNMRTLHHMPSEKRERIARETMEIYAPLAHRLGIESIRRELQDLSFRHIHPADWAAIREQMDLLEPEATRLLERGRENLQEVFTNPSCPAGTDADLEELIWDPSRFGEVRVRATRRWPYQLHRLAGEMGRKVDHPSDLFTYQIITRDRSACYAALGLLHGHFKPVPGRFRDYVALPRPNRYRALHTAVVNRGGTRLEVQIRSRRMDEVAERGIVAHWGHSRDDNRPAWLGQLVDWQGDVNDPSEFIEAVKADLFADEVYVFTPEGDIHTFPKGATAIDFAFAIHTDVGAHCSGARVNGHVVPLRYRMRQGDTVEILTNPSNNPRAEWLKMCVTSRARAKIKHHLRQVERERLRAVGRSLVEQELGARGMSLEDYEQAGLPAAEAEKLGLPRDARDPGGVFEAVGAGTISAWDVARAAAPHPEHEDQGREDRNLFARMLRRMSGRPARQTGGRLTLGRPSEPLLLGRENVAGGGDPDSLIQLAPCCSPVPGDPLVGFFQGGKGIVAHVQGCPEALDHVAEQRVYLGWEDGYERDCPVTLEVRTQNTVGLLAEMSRAFSLHGVNIKQANCRAYDDGERAINTFHASVRTLSQLEALMQGLKQTPGVVGVERVFTAGSGVFPV